MDAGAWQLSDSPGAGWGIAVSWKGVRMDPWGWCSFRHVGICQLLALCSPALCMGVRLSPVHGSLCLLQHGDKLMSYSMA